MGTVVLSHPKQQMSDWQVPVFESPGDTIVGWVQEQIQEGEGFLSGQKSYINLARNMDIFDAIYSEHAKTRSTLISNGLKYDIRKFVETISDVREIGLYGSDAPQYKAYAEIENRLAKAVYLESQYPRQLRRSLQYASVMGVGYLWAKCKTSDYGYGERQIVFEPLGILDAVGVQIPSSNDIQDAYAVTIFDYMPIAEAHGRFPLFQSVLQPVDQTRIQSKLQNRRYNWATKYRFGGGETRNWGNLYCEIRYTFVRDLRINNTGFELPMGEPDTSWSYKAPFVGQQIFGGAGKPAREAGPEDSRVYPYLRLIISSPGVKEPLRDGPGYDWHGKIPLAQYVVDDWPWEPAGVSLVENVATIEQTIRKHERKMDQVITTRLNPPLGYDRTSTAGPKIENIDIFEQDQRAGVDGKPKDVIQSILPDEVQVTETNFKFLEMLTKMREGQLGIGDLTNLENLKLNVSSDSFDKALETIGPIAKGIAMSMEAANGKIAYMLKFMIPQWYDTARIIEYIGPDKIAPDTFDYDPNSLIPSHMPEEYIVGADGSELMKKPDGGSNFSQVERARRFAKNLRLISVPSTLLKITQLQEQTKYMALYGRGFPISAHTVAKKLGIENFGEIEGDTEFEKWINEQKVLLMLKAQAAQLASKLGLGEIPKQQGKQHAGGRPPTDKKAGKPKMKDKSGANPRPIISTSG